MRRLRMISLLAVSTIIFSLFVASWSLRPIIDYYMEGVPDSIDFHTEALVISLMYRNRGSIKASLILTARVEGVRIFPVIYHPSGEYYDTHIRFKVIAESHMSEYAALHVKILNVEKPQNFTVIYTFETASDGSPIDGLITHLFLESHPHQPTKAVFIKTGTDSYERLR